MALKVFDQKPLLLVFPFDLLSHYLRCIVLAKYFSPYFEIVFACSKQYDGFVREAGFETFECLSLDAKKVMDAVKKFDFSWINEKELEKVLNDQLRIIKEYMPVAVIGDSSPSLNMAAEKSGVHFISLMNGYMSKYYAFSRRLSRTHPAYPFLEILPDTMLDAFTKKGEAIAMNKVHHPFKKIRKKYELTKKRSYLDELEGDVNLLCDLEELFPQERLPANYKIIPPLFHNPSRELTKLSEKLDQTKKTIFVSMGSTGDWQKMIFLNNDYFSKFNLVTAGDEQNMLCAPHIIKEAFVNIHELFPGTDLVICHGGNGTIYQSLFYGIPVLCKTSHFEQEWNVSALERLGIGKSLDEDENMDAYILLIEEWITKKNKQVYGVYQQRILEENRKFKDTMKAVTESISEMTIVK